VHVALVGVANFLEAAETAISVDLENKLDFEAEMAAEYRAWH
jgi:hypothetical protein